MTKPHPLTSITEFAFWTTFFRDLESKRDDALFVDEFADYFLTHSHFSHIRDLPLVHRHCWLYSVRTKLFDKNIMELVSNGEVDVVVNLGAGLDMRPYRLDLPSNLQWVEVDFPELIEYKETALSDLKGVASNCAVTRLSCDLSSKVERMSLYKKLSTLGSSWVFISEGCLVYYSNHEVEALLDEFSKQPESKAIIFDFLSDFGLEAFRRGLWGALNDAGLQLRLGLASSGLQGFFCNLGWVPSKVQYLLKEADKIDRKPPFLWKYWWRIKNAAAGALCPRTWSELSGVTLLRRP
jgi:methyltransferase (TIGR00027 family)